MPTLQKYCTYLHMLLNKTRPADFIAPLLLRLYLAPIFISAGLNKLNSFDSVVMWFGNSDWGLGLPAPFLMAFLATATEIIGGFALLFGIATRWLAAPLMFTMIIAMTTAHWGNGWYAIAPSNPETSMSAVLAPVNFPGAKASLENSEAVGSRLSRAKNILQENGNYEWLTETGNFVVLNNGIEFAATYFIMLLALFFMGAGRYISLDYWLHKRLINTTV
ncbi:DoxX family protein [Marinagarivorans cellulosilyticus]|uniref:Oxidoreductase n=1 Tax=Marinagarivorans cellulosilyticus TaxID=2721545 RepID=A0AAN2BJ52_9GAMM|nr:DoxX family protein [Marinagarivorans cellulosilyticus]BCD96602.1 putative oxidoreductase [Marinagarivorans cellulosilyticus]